MLARFPFLAQPPHRLPQPHGQRGNRLQPLFSSLRNLAVVFSVDLREQQLRVPQNSRQRVVQLVPQHFSKVFVCVCVGQGFRRAGSSLLRLPQPPLHHAQRRPQRLPLSPHEVHPVRGE